MKKKEEKEFIKKEEIPTFCLLLFKFLLNIVWHPSYFSIPETKNLEIFEDLIINKKGDNFLY